MSKLFKILANKSEEAGKLEIESWTKSEKQSDEDYNDEINKVRNCFKLKLVIKEENGKALIGPMNVVLNSPDFPEKIKSVYAVCGNDLKSICNLFPKNSFEIFLDFSKPRILDLSFLPSHDTPNESNVKITGLNTTWVHGVFGEVMNFIEERASKFSIVHKNSIYDIFLWVLGFPLAFWGCYKLSTPIESIGNNINEFFRNAVYVYAFLVTLFLFRILFHYLRWVCPLVEYRAVGNSIIKHRAFLATILIGIVGAFIYDLIKTIF